MVNLVSLSTAPAASSTRDTTTGWAVWSLFQRPNNTTVYALGDVISDATSLTTANQLYFPGAGRAGRVVGAVLLMENPAATTHYELFVFDRPVTDHADNAPMVLSTSDYTAVVARFLFTDATRTAINNPTNTHYYYDVQATNQWPATGRCFVSETSSLYGLLVVRAVAPAAVTAQSRVMVRLSLEGQ